MLPSGVRGRAPVAKRFSCTAEAPDASPGTCSKQVPGGHGPLNPPMTESTQHIATMPENDRVTDIGTETFGEDRT